MVSLCFHFPFFVQHAISDILLYHNTHDINVVHETNVDIYHHTDIVVHNDADIDVYNDTNIDIHNDTDIVVHDDANIVVHHGTRIDFVIEWTLIDSAIRYKLVYALFLKNRSFSSCRANWVVLHTEPQTTFLCSVRWYFPFCFRTRQLLTKKQGDAFR